MPLAISSRDLTTFVFKEQSHRFTRCQWGLLNAGTSFQRYIDVVLSGVEGVDIYMDDILVFAPSVEVMLQRL